MKGRLEGKVAFLTGAARGNGRQTAVRFAQEGADIIGVDQCGELRSAQAPASTPEDLAETVRLVEAEDRRMYTYQCDVRDEEPLSQGGLFRTLGRR